MFERFTDKARTAVIAARAEAADPGFHDVPAGPQRRAVRLMVPVCHEFGFLGTCRLAAAIG